MESLLTLKNLVEKLRAVGSNATDRVSVTNTVLRSHAQWWKVTSTNTLSLYLSIFFLDLYLSIFSCCNSLLLLRCISKPNNLLRLHSVGDIVTSLLACSECKTDKADSAGINSLSRRAGWPRPTLVSK